MRIDVAGLAVPRLVYGTAWKEAQTEALVRMAIERGFRGIDTANQRKHYHEQGVGNALREVWAAGALRREDFFLQTKFTFRGGQDHRLPYDPSAPIAAQVEQSFESSLAHLGVETIDSYVLHGPSQRPGLGKMDHEAWRAMEKVHRAGRARVLGVSNVDAPQLEELLLMKVRPSFVQNRCYASRGWDERVRAICKREGLVYQGFSLLTANREVVEGPIVKEIARRHARTREQIVLRFAIDLGMIALTGTTDPRHMSEDLAIADLTLDAAEIGAIAGAGS